jgi:hypothetical protein
MDAGGFALPGGSILFVLADRFSGANVIAFMGLFLTSGLYER